MIFCFINFFRWFGGVGGYQGRIQDFKLRGAHFKKLRRADGGTKMFGVFRVKNQHFMQKNHIFSNFRGERDGCAPWIRPWFRSCGLKNPNDLFGLLPPKNFKKYLASNLTTLSISDKDYFRNASCALHLISIYVFIIFYHLKQCITTMDYHFRKSGWSRVLLRYL